MSDFFLEYCHNALREASIVADDALDALAIEALDLMYGPGVGRQIWSVVGRLRDPRGALLNEIQRGIQREQRAG